MEQALFPCCYYPTTVVLIDDNPTFLKNVLIQLDKSQTTYKLFSEPVHAAKYLLDEYFPNPFSNHCLRRPMSEPLEHRTIDVDIRAIHKETFNSLRFAQISLILIDYAMPGIDGLTMCRQIKDPFMKKVLLTGEADEKLAIRAFNEGIIDGYIRKDDHDFENTVNNTIKNQQREYFLDQSKVIIKSLTESLDKPTFFFVDQTFANYFNDICKQVNAVEYYLMDTNGSFMFLDKDAKPSWLAVKNEEDMREFYEYAASEDTEDTPEGILIELNNRTKLPYFHTDEDFLTPTADWAEYMHPAKLMHGKDIYYYALITDPDAYSINPEKVLSFNQYRNKLKQKSK